MTVLDIQINPANTTWPQLRDRVQRAEDEGYGACWVFDHLAGVALGGPTMLECFSLLGALTQVTSTIELGTLVANAWNREVGTLVSAAGSIATMAGRPFHFGVGAGTSPTSAWAAEQHAVGTRIEPSLAARHERVEAVIDLARREWRTPREQALETFPLPPTAPKIIVGANSVRLSEIAGRCADGINVHWDHPRRDEFLAAASAAAGDRPFLLTTYVMWDDDLLDPDHPTRREMIDRRIDRAVLAWLGPL